MESRRGETKVTDDEGSAEGMGRARPGPTPTADEVERDDEVGTTDLIVPQAVHITARSARLDGSELGYLEEKCVFILGVGVVLSCVSGWC